MEENLQHNTNNEGSESIRKQKRTVTFTRKTAWITVLVIILLIAILWIWKALQINSINKQHAEREQELKEQTEALLIRADSSFLKLLAKPFVWAIRTEMMNGNISQVNLYANDMVKEKNFQLIVVADDKGTIVSSTDKKLEGKAFSTVGKQAYLTTNSTTVEQDSDNIMIMASPIMGFNSRLGTLMLTYAHKKPVFN